MDFRTCPACKASVLEDDVEDCPFCGASMSGKPSAPAKPKPAAGPAKPAKAPGSGPAEKTEKPAAKPPSGPAKGGPRRPFGETVADEDNPFDVDTTAFRKAVPVSPKPTKSRTYEIKCKMCDSVGYISPNDAGKDVKCYNPSCLSPVFKSPPIIKEKTDEKEKSGLSVITMVLIGVVLVAAGGGAAFIFFKQKPPEVVEKDIIPVAPTQTNLKELVQHEVRVEEKKELTPDQLRKKVQAAIGPVARGGDKARPVSVKLQYAVEGLADTGDLKNANDMMALLRREDKSQHFFQIQPLVAISLRQLAEGKQAEAEKSAEAALKLVDRLPKQERQSLDAITSLAALQIQLGKPSVGIELIKKHADATARGVTSAIWMAAIEGQTYDIDLEAGRPVHVSMTSPTWVGLVETLTARGASEQAVEVCQSPEIPNVDARDNTYAAWASMLAVRGGLTPANLTARIDDVVTTHQLGPVTQSRIWSAVAYQQAMAQLEGDAQQSLQKAEAALAQAPTLSPSGVPNMKALYNSRGRFFAGLPDPAPYRSQTLTTLAIALVNAKLGKTDAAVTAFQNAMKTAQAIAPSKVQTLELINACEKNRPGIQSQLQSILSLKNPNQTELDRVFSAYRGQVYNLDEEATRRFNLEADMIRSIVETGIVEPVWAYVQSRIEASSPVDQQAFLKSDVPGYIGAQAFLRNQQDLARTISTLIDTKGQPVNSVDLVLADAGRTANSGNVKEAADKIDTVYRKGESKSQRLDLEVLRLLCRLSHSHDSVALSKQFLFDITHDVHTRENGFRLLAARAMQSGTGQKVWEMLQEQDVKYRMSDADEVAAMRGLLERIPVQK